MNSMVPTDKEVVALIRSVTLLYSVILVTFSYFSYVFSYNSNNHLY